MTENVYGIWKRRFPFLKSMRTNYSNSKKNISCSAVLHNWSIDFGDPPVDDGEEGQDELPLNEDHRYIIVQDDADRNVRLRRGQERRDQLLANMPRARPSERRRGLI